MEFELGADLHTLGLSWGDGRLNFAGGRIGVA
jgi:hypothetical protein